MAAPTMKLLHVTPDGRFVIPARGCALLVPRPSKMSDAECTRFRTIGAQLFFEPVSSEDETLYQEFLGFFRRYTVMPSQAVEVRAGANDLFEIEIRPEQFKTVPRPTAPSPAVILPPGHSPTFNYPNPASERAPAGRPGNGRIQSTEDLVIIPSR